MFQTKFVDKIKTNILCSKTFSENRTVYEITWRNIVDPDRSQMTLGPMCFSCWLRKAANTHSEYVILIGYPRQQWLLERASMLRYTYIACLVSFRKDKISNSLVALIYRLKKFFYPGGDEILRTCPDRP